jgi:cobalamin biosynthesis Mg chelatase CobN
MQTSYRGIHETEDPEEIADILRIHEKILEDKLTAEVANGNMEEAYNKAREMPIVISGDMSVAEMAERIGYRQFASLTITYELRSGWTATRDYYMWTDTPEAELANRYLSRLESVFYHEENIDSAQDLMNLVRAPGHICVNEFMLPEEFLTADNVRSLLEAVIADCEAGTLTQTDGFHDGLVIDTGTTVRKGFFVDVNLMQQGLYFQIYADSENCLAWMENTGILEYITQRRNTYG